MRGQAAIVVALFHGLGPFELGHVLRSAHLAVDFFFALSGIVIAHAYEHKLQRGMTLRTFLLRRLIRLYPLLLLGLSMGLVVMLIRVHVQLDPSYLPAVFKSFVAGLWLLPSPYLTEIEHGLAWPLNIPMWSLFAELLMNVVYAAFLAKRSSRTLLCVLLGALALTTWGAYQYRGFDAGNHWQDVSFGLVRVLYPFVIGVLLYRWHSHQSVRTQGTAAAWLAQALLVSCLVLPVPSAWAAVFQYVAVVGIFPCAIWLGALQKGTAYPRRLDFGQLSYAIYVLHYPVVKVCSFLGRKLHVHGTSAVFVVGLEVCVAIAVAYVADRFYDQPLQRLLKARLQARSARVQAAAADIKPSIGSLGG